LIDADGLPDPDFPERRVGNSNNWTIDRGTVTQCGGHGIHVHGNETRGGYCAALYLAGIGGHGVNEHSFGGCTWVGVYVEVAHGRSFLADNGGSVFLGCRAEGNEKPMMLENSTLFLGGTGFGMDPLSRGLVALGGWRVYPFEVLHSEKVGTEVYFKDYEQTELALGWRHPDEELPAPTDPTVLTKIWWDLSYNQDGVLWELARHGLPPACYFTGKKGAQNSHVDGEGLIGFPKFLLGAAADPLNPPLKVAVASAQPDDSEGKKGDVTFSRSPEPGDNLGWVKTSKGWKAFGKIDP